MTQAGIAQLAEVVRGRSCRAGQRHARADRRLVLRATAIRHSRRRYWRVGSRQRREKFWRLTLGCSRRSSAGARCLRDAMLHRHARIACAADVACRPAAAPLAATGGFRAATGPRRVDPSPRFPPAISTASEVVGNKPAADDRLERRRADHMDKTGVGTRSCRCHGDPRATPLRRASWRGLSALRGADGARSRPVSVCSRRCRCGCRRCARNPALDNEGRGPADDYGDKWPGDPVFAPLGRA